MKKYFFILFFLPFSMISQNRDYVIFDGKKYKGKLLQYFNKDISTFAKINKTLSPYKVVMEINKQIKKF